MLNKIYLILGILAVCSSCSSLKKGEEPTREVSATEEVKKVSGDDLASATAQMDALTDKALKSSEESKKFLATDLYICLLYTSPSPRDRQKSRMPSSA